MSELQQSLERELEGLGFARGFTTHLTGQNQGKAPTPQRRRLGQALAATTIERREALPVKEIDLIQSDLTPPAPPTPGCTPPSGRFLRSGESFLSQDVSHIHCFGSIQSPAHTIPAYS